MPIVFVSHAAVDAQIATLFKNHVEDSFLGLCSLFVSSNLDSLSAGEDWNKNIKKNLSEAVILIGLLSPIAVSRPWVYFEFGAGAIRDIRVIPLCHSGLNKDDLPAPISIYQAIYLADPQHLKHVYEQISAALGCGLPSVNFEERAKQYREITESKRISSLVIDWINQLLEWNKDLSNLISKKIDEVEIMIPSNLEPAFSEFRKIASLNGYFLISNQGMGIGTRVGAQASIFKFERGERFSDLELLLKQSS